MRLDLRIGYLHAYPNGELQFENFSKEADIDSEVKKINDKRFNSRKQDQLTEANLESVARAMSQNSRTVTMKSCFESVKTPVTRKSNKSQLSRVTDTGIGGFNTITKDWYRSGTVSNNGARRDIYSNFSKKTS